MTTQDHDRFSVCQLAIPGTSLAEDLAICTDLGIGCIGLDERKMAKDGDDDLRGELARRGIAAGICAPTVLSVLPTPAIPGPDDPGRRIEAICESVRRFARFDPASVFVVTGPCGEHDEGTAHKLAVDGLREVLATARSVGVTLSIEPMRMSHHDTWTFVNSLAQMLALIDEVGDDLKITYDVWHLWDSPDVLPLTRRHGSSIAGVQISDYRQPSRVQQDRLLPGDGVIDLPLLFGTLEEGGFDGWYDLEVFSDLGLPDSVWNRPAREWIAAGRDGFEAAWTARRVEGA